MTGLEIKEFRKKYKLRQGDLAEIAGVTHGAVQNWEYGHRNMPKSVIKLLQQYEKSQFSSDFSDDFNSTIKPEQKIVNEVSQVPFDDYMMVECAALTTVAGLLGGDNLATIPETKKILVPKEYEKGKYLVITVEGDSMDDGTNISIPNGAEILVREYTVNKGEYLPIRNNLFVIVSRSGTVIKQIIEQNNEDEYLIVHSYNSKYKDYKIHFDEIIQMFIFRKIIALRPSIPEF